MRRKLRRSTNKCLFCFKNCTDGPGTSSNLLGIPGAVKCGQLEEQLEKWFILRQLLDVPVPWCEQTLGRGSVRVGGDDSGQINFSNFGGFPIHNNDNDGSDSRLHAENEEGDGTCMESWFKVCKPCMTGSVRKGWEVYQKLMAVQSQLATIKTEIRRKMKDAVRSNWGSCSMSKVLGRGKQVEDEIRAVLFPDLILELEAAESVKEETMDVDFDDSNFADSPYQPHTDNDDDDIMSPKLSKAIDIEDPSSNFACDPRLLPKVKRRRGRPKKNEQRRPTSNPNYYYSKFYGQLKKIKFKWKKCSQCPAKYKREDDLQRHLELHERRKQSGNDEFDCKQCPFIADNLVDLGFHTRNHHQRDHNLTHSCPKCDFTTKTWKILKLHVGQFHTEITEEEMDAKLKFKCPGCPQEFGKRKALNFHLKREHPELVGITEELVECDKCQLRFASKQELHSHVYNTHNRPSKYVCDLCGMGFPYKSRLETHTEVHHPVGPARKHICHLCGCDYTARYTLLKHYRNIHPEHTPSTSSEAQASEDAAGGVQEDFKCKYCDLTSPFKVVIIRHMEAHKKEMGHECDQCGKCYTSEQGLKRHIRINHPTEKDAKVPCPYCSKTYPSVEYMKDHLSKYCKLKKFPGIPTAAATATATGDDTTGQQEIKMAYNLTTSAASTKSEPEVAFADIEIQIDYDVKPSVYRQC